MKALLLDITNLTIKQEVEVFSTEVVDSMYYDTEIGCIPIAYLLDPRHKVPVLELLYELARRKHEFLKFEHELLATRLPKYRIAKKEE